MSDLDFTNNFSKTLDKCITAYDKYMVIGDLNYNLLYYNKGRTLSDLLENFDVIHLISKATCFMKNCQPSLLDFNCMKANPDKFQAIAVGRRTHDKSPIFKLGDINIPCDEVVKLLGVDIDFSLNFDSHVKSICKKAAKQLNILKRIGKNLSKLNRLTIFHTFIMSNFNFCPLSWHFCSVSNTKKIEKIQERALRFVYEDYSISYEDLLSKAKLPSLHVRRIRSMAIEIFKILNNIAPPVLSDLVQKRNSKYNFRYSNILQIPQINTTRYGHNSFRYAAPVLWNSLPDDFRSCTNFNQFKNLITSWNGVQCKCAACNTKF